MKDQLEKKSKIVKSKNFQLQNIKVRQKHERKKVRKYNRKRLETESNN